MVDTVTSEYIFDGDRLKVLHLTGISDATGEIDVVKADLSAITFDEGKVPTYSTIDRIEYDIQGYDSIRLHWDHTTNDLIAILPTGRHKIDWRDIGGKTDPQSAGGTGDIILTSDGGVAGGTYDIRIYFRPKA